MLLLLLGGLGLRCGGRAQSLEVAGEGHVEVVRLYNLLLEGCHLLLEELRQVLAARAAASLTLALHLCLELGHAPHRLVKLLLQQINSRVGRGGRQNCLIVRSIGVAHVRRPIVTATAIVALAVADDKGAVMVVTTIVAGWGNTVGGGCGCGCGCRARLLRGGELSLEGCSALVGGLQLRVALRQLRRIVRCELIPLLVVAALELREVGVEVCPRDEAAAAVRRRIGIGGG